MTEPIAISRRAIPHSALQTFAQSATQATFQTLHRVLVLLAVLVMSLSFIKSQPAQAQGATAVSNPQPAILAANSASNQIVVYPDASQPPPPTQKLVSGLPSDATPQGVAYYGKDNALISDRNHPRVFVVKVSTATVLATIDTSTAGYDGTGTIAVAPDLNTALASGRDNNVYVIRGPFNASSTVTKVALPGSIGTYQTQAIVFNNAGRAFVYNSVGISVLDAPYTSVAFTIPVNNLGSGAIGITPDGNTLLTTDFDGNTLRIFSAPFSASSTSAALTFGNVLDGVMVTPDGTKALVVDAGSHNAYAVSAPFTSSSKVETLPLPAGTRTFEDVGISADSQIAILAGNSTSEAPVFVRAPFTAAGATSYYVPVNATNPARGLGSVRFQPPGLAPGLSITKSAAATVAPSSDLTYTLTYANTGNFNEANVVIRDPLPAGTTFVSATNGGAVSGGSVVFNIGTVSHNTSSQTASVSQSVSAAQTVSFTVHVTAAAGATITNSGYTIEATGVAPIPGPPVTTTVTGGTIPPPVANPDNATVAQNSGATAIDVLANDLSANGNPKTITGVGSASHGTVTFNGGQVFYQPTAGYTGSDSFQYSISDSYGGTATGTVFITVNAVATGHHVFGRGIINVLSKKRVVFSFDATTIGSGPQASGTLSFSASGAQRYANVPVQSLVVSNDGTSATFVATFRRNNSSPVLVTYLVTITHNLSTADTFSIQAYKGNSRFPDFSSSGSLIDGFISIS